MKFPAHTRSKPNSTFTPQQGDAYTGRIPPYWIFLIALGLVSYFIFSYSNYEEVVTTDPNGNPILTPERQAELERRQKKNTDEAEQYVLRAIAPGYRECYLCPEGKVWLEAEEIAKIGVSTDGEDRYALKFYEKHGVYYDMEYRGDLTTAKNREIARLGGYPLLPENQKREHKLLYPPLNTKLD